MKRRELVVGVVDGDTFETDSRRHPVRLANVNAPARGGLGYAPAKMKLMNLIHGKEVTIETVARDKYGRSVAKVKLDGRSVNAAMSNRNRR